MAINIEMPKLSDTMTEGTVVKWCKQVGDSIEVGDIIAEIETDKATMEMEAFDDGTLSSILVEAGAKAPVNEVIAILAEDGEEVGAASVAPAAAAPVQTSSPAEPTSSVAAPTNDPAPVVTADGSRIKASPLARKIAASENIELTNLQGTGPGGRIVKKDVLGAPKTTAAPSQAAAAASALANVAATRAPNAAASAPVSVPSMAAGEGDQRIELSSMRRIIADRLLTSKTTIPHFYLHVEVDAKPLMDIRKQINAQAEATHGNKYTVNDFIIKALINATLAVPAVNASFNGDHVIQYKNVGVSVAIAVEDGLVTPVIKEAEAKSLLQISREVKDMAKRARDKKLRPDEFDGGTVTISNLGSYGIESFDAIVNPPQAAILSVGGISEKAVVKNGEIVPGLRMNLGLSCDHRVVDGAVAATFLGEVKKLIENPALMLV